MESGKMIAAIAAVIIAVVIAIGGKASNAFEKVDTGLSLNQMSKVEFAGHVLRCELGMQGWV